MIKVEANKGRIDIEEINGNTLRIMAELCGIVRAVCTACWEDEEDGADLTEAMINKVAEALLKVKPKDGDLNAEKTN